MEKQEQIQELNETADRISTLLAETRLSNNVNAMIPLAQVLASVRLAQYTGELTGHVEKISGPLVELRDKISGLDIASIISLAKMFKKG